RRGSQAGLAPAATPRMTRTPQSICAQFLKLAGFGGMFPAFEPRFAARPQRAGERPHIGDALELDPVFRALGKPATKACLHFRRAMWTVQTGDPGCRFGSRCELPIHSWLLAIQSRRKNAARATCFSTMLTLMPNCSAICR